MRFRNCGIPIEEMLAVSSTAGCAVGFVGLANVFACSGDSAGALSPTLCKRWRPKTEYWFDNVLVRASKFLGGVFSALDWLVVRMPLSVLMRVEAVV